MTNPTRDRIAPAQAVAASRACLTARAEEKQTVTELAAARAALHPFEIISGSDRIERFEAAVRASERAGITARQAMTAQGNWPGALGTAPAPATDQAVVGQADLRDRIATVLAGTALKPPFPHCLAMADAVLAVLPPPADRPAVLREAATAIEAEQAREEATAWAQTDEPDPEIDIEGAVVRARAALLRRMANEETP